jgi:acylglycerol lipase
LTRAAKLAALGEGKEVPGLKLDPGCPVWLGHGSEDGVTSYDASKKLFEKLKVADKTFKTYHGAYHKLHAEPEGVKEEFVKHVGEWILAHIPGQEGEVDVKAKL